MAAFRPRMRAPGAARLVPEFGRIEISDRQNREGQDPLKQCSGIILHKQLCFANVTLQYRIRGMSGLLPNSPNGHARLSRTGNKPRPQAVSGIFRRIKSNRRDALLNDEGDGLS
jgi:hypothetical protein